MKAVRKRHDRQIAVVDSCKLLLVHLEFGHLMQMALMEVHRCAISGLPVTAGFLTCVSKSTVQLLSLVANGLLLHTDMML